MSFFLIRFNRIAWFDAIFDVLGSYQEIGSHRRRRRRWRFFSATAKDKFLRKQFGPIDEGTQTTRARQCGFALRTSQARKTPASHHGQGESLRNRTQGITFF